MALGAMQQISKAGLTPSYAAPGTTESITPDDNLFLHVKNANAANCTVTITDPGTTPAGSAATNPTVVVPLTSGDRMISLPRSFASPTTGLIAVAFSVQSSVSVALLRL
jgi:hypothetical protein